LQNELRSLFDLYLDYYFDLYVNEHGRQPNAIFSGLAFVILGVVTMYRATGAADYSGRLGRLCDVLLDFEVRFEDVAGNPASHSDLEIPKRVFGSADTVVINHDCRNGVHLARSAYIYSTCFQKIPRKAAVDRRRQPGIAAITRRLGQREQHRAVAYKWRIRNSAAGSASVGTIGS
jgi:hypothetical protein